MVYFWLDICICFPFIVAAIREVMVAVVWVCACTRVSVDVWTFAALFVALIVLVVSVDRAAARLNRR